MTTIKCATKHCPLCEKTLPRHKFYLLKGKYFTAYCKTCHKLYHKIKYKLTKTKI